jgi:hypothetical protein
MAATACWQCFSAALAREHMAHEQSSMWGAVLNLVGCSCCCCCALMFMHRGEVRVVGCTSADKYRKFIEKDPGLERRFQVREVVLRHRSCVCCAVMIRCGDVHTSSVTQLQEGCLSGDCGSTRCEEVQLAGS